jgi:hypothetical protein
VKLIQDFEKFLEDEVNLNRSRLETLTDRVDAVKRYLSNSDWRRFIKRYGAQGSWAHKTIITPPGDQGFDADLAVYLNPVSGWTPKNYILNLRSLFKSSGTYKDITKLRTRCVAIDYSGDFRIDIVPYVVNRPGMKYTYEVCNREDDDYEPTDGEAFTEWLDEKNAIVGEERFREVVRLLKYLRDIKSTFSCKSIVLTTLLGEQVAEEDQLYRETYYSDLPTALKTLVGRLDDFLKANPNMPEVHNPVLSIEVFTRHWDDEKYETFREVIGRYRGWIDDAYDEADEDKGREKWQRVFGSEFGKATRSIVSKSAAYAEPPVKIDRSRFRDAIDQLLNSGTNLLSSVSANVPWMKPTPWLMRITQSVVIRATAHKDRSGSNHIGPVVSGEIIPTGIELKFEALTPTGTPYTSSEYEVKWQVTNTDHQAWSKDALRGGFYSSKPRGVRWEKTEYRGIHWVQAFVIKKRTGACIARSERFFVAIE